MVFINIFYINELNDDENIEQIKNHKINIFIGKPFSGKSYSVEKYIKNTLYSCDIKEKIFLYDFNIHDVSKFINQYKGNEFKEYTLILDNIDILSNADYSELLFNLKSENFSKLILITSNGKSIKDYFSHVESINTVNNRLLLGKDILNSYEYVVRTKNKKYTNLAEKIDSLLDNIINLKDDAAFLYVVKSIFRNVEIRNLKKCFNKSSFEIYNLKRKLRIYSMLDEGDCFINRNVSIEILIKNLSNNQLNKKYLQIMTVIEKAIAFDDYFYKWMIALFYFALRGITVDRDIFDNAIFNCNLNDLLYVLERFSENFILDETLTVYRAILLERCNEPYPAMELYNKLTNSQDKEVREYAKIGYLCCGHTRKDILPILNSVQEISPFIAYSKRYWQLHIDMHRGEFHYPEFKNLLDDLNSNIKLLINYSKYDVYHLLRRVYFETIRAYLLTNVNNLAELKQLNNLDLPVPSFLIKNNPNEFLAYYYKFNIGRVLQYDVIGSSAIDGTICYVDIADYLLQLFYTRECIVNLTGDYIDKNIKIFDKSIELFSRIGGPYENYVIFNKYELLVTKDVKFRQPILNFCYNYINECKEKKLYEYVHYAVAYLIKFQFCWQLSPEPSSQSFIIDIKNAITDCKKYINLSEENGINHFNQYSICRVEMFDILFDLLSLGNMPSCDLINKKNEIVEKCKEFSKKYATYTRELAIVNSIIKRESSVSPRMLLHWIRYYPIVNQ